MSAASPLSVLLADDQAMVRAGIRLILESDPGIRVVGEAGNGAEAIALAARGRPEIVLMDIQMPVMDGVEATRRLLRAGPEGPHRLKVIILTTFERDEYVFEALRAGASGFLLKNAPPEELIAAVRTVADGGALLAPSVTRRVIEEFATVVRRPSRADELARLTEREREVLRLLARGLSNAEMAATLFLGEATVKSHVSSILGKLELRDRVQAVVFAYEAGVAGTQPA